MPTGHPKEKRANDGTLVVSPIIIEDHKKFYEGTVYRNKLGQKFVITNYHNADDVGIKFLDKYGYENRVYMSTIPKGAVKNPYTPGKFGYFVGDGPYGRKRDKKAYFVWADMHQRVYYAKNDIHYMTSDIRSYVYASVDERWHNFQVFAEWYYEYLKRLNPNYDYFIDKDILQFSKRYKVYSPETCCLVPSDINECIAGIYTTVQNLPLGVRLTKDGVYYAFATCIGVSEEYGPFDNLNDASSCAISNKHRMINELAFKYYSDGAITEEVLNALYNLDIKPFPVYEDI